MDEQDPTPGDGGPHEADDRTGPTGVPGLPLPPDRGPRNVWAIWGGVLAILLILLGLGLVGAVVLFFVSLSSWGSNK